AEVDGVRRGAPGDVLVADRNAVRVDRHATHEDLVPGDLEAEPFTGRLEDPLARPNDFGADAVPWDRNQAVGRLARANPCHGSFSAASAPTNAPATSPISAPCSLFIATR